MKTVSVRAPWTFLLLRPDVIDPAERAALRETFQIKDVENRSWATSHRGPLLIHASSTMTGREYTECLEFALSVGYRGYFPPREKLERGGIVGIVDLIDCVGDHNSPWYMGDIGWVMANPRPLPFVPMKGKLQLFEASHPDV